jgi:KaiC/GvpD/RAD55 family RecA-like ATPase
MLTILAFKDAQNIDTNSGYLIPSPLNIIYNLLIVPEYAFTAAYSVSTCTTFLYDLYNISPAHPKVGPSEISKSDSRIFSESQIFSALNDFEGFMLINNRWPKTTPDDKSFSSTPLRVPEIQSFLGSFLSFKGITHLWFGDTNSKKSVEVAKNFLKFTLNKKTDFVKEVRKKLITNRFRMSSRYREVPERGRIINQLFGFPIPLEGADILFFGGLRPASYGGLVMSISGRAGVGKTSLALALANAYAGFGSNCFYISLEEDILDLERRLYTLRPKIHSELSFFSDNTDWFYGIKPEKNFSLDEFTLEIQKIGEELNESKTSDDRLTHIIPSIIVIDNLNELIDNSQQYSKIEAFIEACRKLNSLVILLSPEGVPKELKLEYLIDVGIELSHKSLNEENEKPIRIFNLYKTRHQLSRQGSHVYHMNGDDGFKISPQIPSQIDRKEQTQRFLRDSEKIIHSLNLFGKTKKSTLEIINKLTDKKQLSRKFYLELYPRTHILVHGYGSAGKAGFSLNLLLTPPLIRNTKIEEISKQDFGHKIFQRNILIISFLYPEKYYNDVVNKTIQKEIKKTYKNIPNPLLEFLVLYPGFLTPQDFLKKITKKLDEANLKGKPFTGVLIDGLHNVFLQFEKLQDSNMVWPMLYNILSRYDLTVVSTFTNFSLNDKLYNSNSSDKNQLIHQAIPDHILLQKGMAPFLHALVKASDFYFFMEEVSSIDGEKRFILAVKSAINQDIPEEFLEWDRETNQFVDVYTFPKLNKFISGKYD